jgi:hypothetical protein
MSVFWVADVSLSGCTTSGTGRDRIDEVVGKGGLPTWADEASLPHVSSVIKEVLRFAPVVCLGKLSAVLGS